MKPENILSQDELQQYDVRNALQYLVSPQTFGKSTGLEQEISGRAIKAGASEHGSGIFIPAAVFARDLVVGTPTAGGNLVETKLQGMIDLLRPSSAVVAAGATVMEDLVGNVAVPRMTGGSTMQWVAENSAGAESNPAFDQVPLTPKTVTGFVDLSRRLVLQASTDAIKLVQRDLMDAVGTALDVAAINGSGASNQPRGVLQTAGIGSVAGGTNGAAPTYDNMVELETQVANANTPTRNLGYVTNTKVRGRLQRTQRFTGTNGDPVWAREDGADRINGRPAAVSNNVPSTLTKGTSTGVCSAILYGAWADLVIGIWGRGVTLMVDPYTNSTTGGVRLIVMLDCDIALRYPTSFAAMLDALTT